VACIQEEEETRSINDFRPPIKRIPDDLWDEIRKVLPKEKSSKTVGRPIVPYRKVLDGILYVLRTEWNSLDIFKNIWIKLLKIYDGMIGINWAWQSIDSISIKSPLGGR
jgi:hypothetical protein